MTTIDTPTFPAQSDVVPIWQFSELSTADVGYAGGGEPGVGAHPDRHEHEIGRDAERLAVGAAGADFEPVGRSRFELLDCIDAGGARHLDAVTQELGVDERAEVGVDGGEHFEQLLDLGHGDAARDERLGHLEADLARADDDRPCHVVLLEGPHEGEGVSHRVQEVNALVRAEDVEAGDRWPDCGNAPVATTIASYSRSSSS